MSEIQKVSLNVLKIITDIMDREGFVYVLAYGTLIGAVRHNGYIPWDDDVDIMMPRPDYERFLKYTQEHRDELGFIVTMNMEINPNYPYMITRMCDSRYELEVENEDRCGMGIFVDIYPIDGVGNSLEEAKQIFNKTAKYPSFIFLATRKYFTLGLTKGILRRALKLPVYIYTHLMGKNYFVRKLNSLLSSLDYRSSMYVSNVAWDSRPVAYEKRFLQERIKLPFEDFSFYVPKEYDKMLRLVYGDYMLLPPENERIYHHLYKAYLKNED